MLQNGLDMVNVFPTALREYKNIVQVHNNKCIQHVPEYVVHQRLEHSGGVCESGFPLVSFSDPDQVVGVTEVQLRKNGCALQ